MTADVKANGVGCEEDVKCGGRHIFVGDVHGCIDELLELLSRAAVTGDDVVIALGDLTRKGPAPDRCVELWIERRYLAVLGNNDAKMLARAPRLSSRVFASSSDRKILWRSDLLQEISRWPLHLDFPDIRAVSVHGGILPNSSRPILSLAKPRSSFDTFAATVNGGWSRAEKRRRAIRTGLKSGTAIGSFCTAGN